MYWLKQTLILPQLIIAIAGVIIIALATFLNIMGYTYIEIFYILDDMRNDNE